MKTEFRRSLRLTVGGVPLHGEFVLPAEASGVVVFATGTAGARHATLETGLTRRLHRLGVATLVVDLVSPEESGDRAIRSETGVLGRRLEAQTAWLDGQSRADGLERLLCGTDTGAAAAVDRFAAGNGGAAAMVLLNGRVDLADRSLANIGRPVLFVLDGDHAHLAEANRSAYERLGTEPDRKHFLRTADRDARDIVARWMSHQLEPRTGARTADPATDRRQEL